MIANRFDLLYYIVLKEFRCERNLSKLKWIKRNREKKRDGFEVIVKRGEIILKRDEVRERFAGSRLIEEYCYWFKIELTAMVEFLEQYW